MPRHNDLSSFQTERIDISALVCGMALLVAFTLQVVTAS
jgi:hypothetical protein